MKIGAARASTTEGHTIQLRPSHIASHLEGGVFANSPMVIPVSIKHGRDERRVRARKHSCAPEAIGCEDGCLRRALLLAVVIVRGLDSRGHLRTKEPRRRREQESAEYNCRRQFEGCT